MTVHRIHNRADIQRVNDEAESYSHVKGRPHGVRFDISHVLDGQEDIWDSQTVVVDICSQAVRDGACQVSFQSAPGDVGHGIYELRIALVDLSDPVVEGGRLAQLPQESVLERFAVDDLPYERITIGVRPGGREGDNYVASLHIRLPDDVILIHEPGGKAD